MSTLVRRVGALLAACSAVLHVVSLGHAGPVTAVVMVAMIAACGYCAYELWTRATVRAWVLVAVMNLAMIGVHLPMTAGHHHGGGVSPVGAPSESTAMQLAVVVAVVEVLLSVVVLLHHTRRYPGLLSDAR